MKQTAQNAAASWKTTLLGLGLAVLNLYANGANGRQIALSIGLAGLGTLAGDAKTANKQ
jgi:hypothetical protein